MTVDTFTSTSPMHGEYAHANTHTLRHDHTETPAAAPRSAIGLCRYETNARLFNEGQHCAELLEIISGTVIVYRTLSDGRRQVLEIAGPGALLGSPAEARHLETAEARTPVRLRRYCVAEFARTPRLQRMVQERMMARVGAMQELAVMLGRKTATERVATFLLRLLGISRTATCPSGRIEGQLDLTQADISDHLGLSIETVCRELSRMKRAGIVALDRRGRLVIDEPLRLAALADRPATASAATVECVAACA